jgi:hypothetical protein
MAWDPWGGMRALSVGLPRLLPDDQPLTIYWWKRCLWEQLEGQIYPGSDEFVESMLRRADSGQALGEVPRVQRQPVPPPLAYFDRTFADPKEGMAKAYLSGGTPQSKWRSTSGCTTLR